MKVVEKTVEHEVCYHCGDACKEHVVELDNKSFCCNGCRAVFELFSRDNLSDFYQEKAPFKKDDLRFEFLDNAKIISEVIDFRNDEYASVRLSLPSIHCSSCIYILENLYTIEPGIIDLRVNFEKREAVVRYNPNLISLREVAELLSSVGYKPDFKLKTDRDDTPNTLPLKIGVAAFCFGNIMLLSFPEYLGLDLTKDVRFSSFFSYLSIALSLPVIFYAATDYLSSAWKGITHGFINIDVPIVIGILVLFTRSTYEILAAVGPGYLDSLSGLIFFLLIGKWFQSKTYERLSFERDYKSYFPLSTLKKTEGGLKSTLIKDIREGDLLHIRNNEIIPVDGILLSKDTIIDYSFVTGEEKPQPALSMDQVFAGGKQIGTAIEVKATKACSQSYLTSLWNNEVFKKQGISYKEVLINSISKYFTITILAIAVLAFSFWMFYEPARSWEIFAAVLIVACPCALALSTPFTNGHTMRILGRNKFYLKNAHTAEQLPKVQTIVFDKTGTLTAKENSGVEYIGVELSDYEKGILNSMTGHSTHPLSVAIHQYFRKYRPSHLDSFREWTGKGIRGMSKGINYKLGAAQWVEDSIPEKTGTYLSIDGEVKGYFLFDKTYRPKLKSLISGLSKKYKLAVLSGDNDSERESLQQFFPADVEMLFNQKPEDKLRYIEEKQKQGDYVLMLGDGLNDAGALKQANIGVAVTEDTANFSPASDGILEGEKLVELNGFLNLTKNARGIIILSFILSFLYNFAGIGLAISGLLTPIIAAILMPLSSISVVAFTTIASNYMANKLNL